jgi:hypothetical protein
LGSGDRSSDVGDRITGYDRENVLRQVDVIGDHGSGACALMGVKGDGRPIEFYFQVLISIKAQRSDLPHDDDSVGRVRFEPTRVPGSIQRRVGGMVQRLR